MRWGFPRCGKPGSPRPSGPRQPRAPRSGLRSASSAAPAQTARPARGSVRAQRYRSCRGSSLEHGKSSLEHGTSSSSTSNSGERLEVTVGGDEGSPRLDRVLVVLRPELSRSRLKALILAGSVTARGAPIRDPAYHVGKGDTITIDVPEAVPPEPKGEDIALDIVFEDDDIIVIDKPKGLVVHPAAGHETGTLVNALIAHCGASR